MTLYLIRGVPGTGKSTEAKRIIEQNPDKTFKHFEADMFFVKNGKYNFDPKKIKDAHKWCQSETMNALLHGFDVIVSNTFTQKWEMDPYVKMAEQLGADLKVIVKKHVYGNIHGVPDDKVKAMQDRWED